MLLKDMVYQHGSSLRGPPILRWNQKAAALIIQNRRWDM
jgi:hypothetical protein